MSVLQRGKDVWWLGRAVGSAPRGEQVPAKASCYVWCGSEMCSGISCSSLNSINIWSWKLCTAMYQRKWLKLD